MVCKLFSSKLLYALYIIIAVLNLTRSTNLKICNCLNISHQILDELLVSVVLHDRHFSHSVPLLKSLHWLPICRPLARNATLPVLNILKKLKHTNGFHVYGSYYCPIVFFQWQANAGGYNDINYWPIWCMHW